MVTVSTRLGDTLNRELEDMVEQGIFKDKTDALHEAIRLLLKEYERDLVTR